MNNLPKIKDSDESKKKNQVEYSCLSPERKQKSNPYDYFSSKIPKNTIETILKIEKDDRFVYFLKYGTLRRFEGEADVIFVEIPQIPKKIVVYRRPSYRQKAYDRLYLNNVDMPHIPLFEGEENLKLLSLENNLISKIDHLVSLNYLLYLNLYANKIYEIENLQTVPKLRALMLGKNQIEKIKNLSSLADLEVLDLHSNKIKVVENLSSLKKLRLLNLANNQITSFSELLYNKNLEEINLRKNLIVSVPSGINLIDRLKKLNLGKNMISKIDNLVELKKIKSLIELIIENNPVLVLKEVSDMLKYLPLKIKNVNVKESSSKDLTSNGKNSSNSVISFNIINNVNNFSNNATTNSTSNNNLALVTHLSNSQNLPNTLTSFASLSNSASTNINVGISGSSSTLARKKECFDLVSPHITPLRKTVNFFKEMALPEINTDRDKEKDTMLELTSHPNTATSFPNNALDKEIKSEEITEDQSNNIISHIEKEWKLEFTYIKDNGYNGYNTKRLKESKIVSGHAELEGNNRLNFYGNVFEVLDQEEFFISITTILFEFFNIDLIANKNIVDKLKNFKKLKALIFSNNNLHSFYQLIKFEEFSQMESITIQNNEICDASFLKYFLIYRFQNLKMFNSVDITQKDILEAKKVFEFFDKCISHNDAKNEDDKNGEKENVKGIPLVVTNFESLSRKNEFYNFVQDNLMDFLEEIIDENI